MFHKHKPSPYKKAPVAEKEGEGILSAISLPKIN